MAESAYCQEHLAQCTSATHTYTQTVTITSPSGRTASCDFSQKYPAIDTEDLSCEATLAIDGEGGVYSFADNQQAVCTIAGAFLAQETIGSTTPPSVTLNCTLIALALGSPLSAAPKQTTQGSCTAVGSPSGGTYAWTVSTSAVTLSASGSTASYTAANPSSSQGDTLITVAYTPPGTAVVKGTSAPITVYKPTGLSGSTVTSKGSATCNTPCLASPNSGSCTVKTGTTCSYAAPQFARTYDVLTQIQGVKLIEAIGSANVTESVKLTSNNCGGSGITVGNATSSEFTDTYGKCDSCCQSGGPGCTTVGSQTITVNGYAMPTETITETCTTASATP